MRLFRLVALGLRIVCVAVFGATFLYWVWKAFTNKEVSEQGGFWFSLVPLVLAIVAYFVFGAMAKWAEKRVR